MRMVTDFANKGEKFVTTAYDGVKRLLRETCRETINSFEKGYVEKASKEINKKFLMSEQYKKAKTIFCYLATNYEPSTDKIIKKALSDGKRICIPLCEKEGKMTAREYTEMTPLVKGKFGIMEPNKNTCEVKKEDIDTVIVPCLACDNRGNRIGHGGGYYDRFLYDINAVKIVLSVDRLVLGNVPVYNRDVPMDFVISEKRFIKTGRGIKNGEAFECDFQRNLPQDHLHRIG